MPSMLTSDGVGADRDHRPQDCALLPLARLIELPEVGHGLYVTHASQIVDELRKFVAHDRAG